MEKGDYFRLEFDITPEPGSEEIELFFEWAKNHPQNLVRHLEGTEQIRVLSDSGYQLLFVRPEETVLNPEIGRATLLEVHVVRPEGRDWELAWGKDHQESVRALVLHYIEGVGYVLNVATGENKYGAFNLTETIKQEVYPIFAERLNAIPWVDDQLAR